MQVASERLVQRVWSRFRRTHSQRLRNFLIEHYVPLVREHAQRICAKLPPAVQADEMASVGTLGLMEAIETFDPQRDVKFETYCSRRVSGAIYDELRSLDLMSRLLRQRARRLAHVTQDLWAELGRRPSDEEMAGRMAMPIERFRSFARSARAPIMHSLSGGRDDDDREIGEVAMLADGRTADPTYQAQRGMLRDLISRGLSRADRLILLLYYYEGLNMAQVGRALGLSESRVSQKHKRIVKDLRSRLIGRSNDFEASLAA